MAEITIRIETYNRTPDQTRLARADRYEERAAQAIDRRERAALYAEAERIYREDLR